MTKTFKHGDIVAVDGKAKVVVVVGKYKILVDVLTFVDYFCFGDGTLAVTAKQARNLLTLAGNRESLDVIVEDKDDSYADFDDCIALKKVFNTYKNIA